MFRSEPYHGGLPCPRLELRWEPLADDERHNWFCRYGLVIPVTKGDIRDTGDGTAWFESGTTKCGRYAEGWTPLLEPDCLPFRDGVHAWNDSQVLKLRAFTTYEGLAQEIVPGQLGESF
jgi:hypothetical protein